MKQLLLVPLCIAGLAAASAAQDSDASNSLAFRHGGKIAISYKNINLGEGTTLKNLMDKGEMGDRFRSFFTDKVFKSKIGGKIHLDTTTEIAGNEIDAGQYLLSFRIDEDAVWYLVLFTQSDEEIFASTLDVREDKQSSGRLLIHPLASDNSMGKGRLHIRFGHLAADVPFLAHAVDGGSSEPGGNTNDDAPRIINALANDKGSVEVSYNQLRLAGGKSLKNLLASGERGDRTRQFYNNTYLPKWMAGKLETSKSIKLGDKAVAAGTYGFTFRIDNDLVWHFVVTDDGKDVCTLPLEAAKDNAMSKRLVVQPIGSPTATDKGHLSIRYGPLATELPFAAASGKTDSRPAGKSGSGR